MTEHKTPSDIERTSLAIISAELASRGIVLPLEQAPLVKRVIHATADFDYAENLRFTADACTRAERALASGAPIVTDTNMALSGISRVALGKLQGCAECFMAEPSVAEEAKRENTTRAAISMRKAAELMPAALFAVGNAPTALFELCRLLREGLRPSLVLAVPVGFVNVVEAKEETLSLCRELDVPCIAALGRKGGSTVAAAACNALLYSAADLFDPEKRGWN